jgi:hypothetical protein
MPNNGPDSTGCVYDSGVTPGIRFPSILLLFFGGVFAAFLAYVLAYSLGVPRFASELISALANDGYWIAGYQWLSRERDWSSLRARFAPVPGNVLWKAVGAALALVAFFLSLAAILQGLGVELKAISTIDLLQGGRKALPGDTCPRRSPLRSAPWFLVSCMGSAFAAGQAAGCSLAIGSH